MVFQVQFKNSQTKRACLISNHALISSFARIFFRTADPSLEINMSSDMSDHTYQLHTLSAVLFFFYKLRPLIFSSVVFSRQKLTVCFWSPCFLFGFIQNWLRLICFSGLFFWGGILFLIYFLLFLISNRLFLWFFGDIAGSFLLIL